MKKLNKLLILYVYINWKVVNIHNVLLAWLLVYCSTLDTSPLMAKECKHSARKTSGHEGIFIVPHLL